MSEPHPVDASDLAPVHKDKLKVADEIAVQIIDMNKWYGQFHVLRDVNLTVHRGERIVIAGPSGSGKSTLIRCINRLEEHQSGRIVVDGTELTNDLKNIDKVRSEVGMVFQHFNLFPHKSVVDNVALGPRKLKGLSKDEAREVALRQLEIVGLTNKADVRPARLSGGQQQRVAIARALAAETPLFLLDEPFAALDALTRERLQEDVRQVSAESGRTTVFVTHSAEEAAFLGSRIVVLTRRPGQVALDIPVNLPRTGIDPDDLRRSPEYAELRTEVGKAVKAAAA